VIGDIVVSSALDLKPHPDGWRDLAVYCDWVTLAYTQCGVSVDYYSTEELVEGLSGKLTR